MNLSDTWAERVLDFEPTDSTEPRRIIDRLGGPDTETGMGGSWRVEIEIQDGIDEPLLSHSTGEDSFHVLELALRHISILLVRWEERGKLTWCGDGDVGFLRNYERGSAR